MGKYRISLVFCVAIFKVSRVATKGKYHISHVFCVVIFKVSRVTLITGHLQTTGQRKLNRNMGLLVHKTCP